MASSKIQHRRQRQGSLGLPKDSPPPPMLTAMNGGGGACSGGGGQSGPSQQSLDNLEMMKTIGTGTFGRVMLCREKSTREYWALKILAIADVIRLKQVQHVQNEKNILLSVNHPFIVNMVWTHHDQSFLYMLFDYVCGGELFSYLRNAGRFSSSTGNFYTCEIVCALDYLHTQNVVYRDLKPENLLLDRDGHLKITDFGFAKKLTDRTWTLCGTPEYLAPEIIQSKGHNKAVDWWALGILVYEMLAGYPPFFDDNPFGIYEKILAGKIDWPRHMDPIAKDLVKKLLVQDRTKRLGNMKNGADDVKRHRWFKGLDWDEVFYRKLKPPIVPKVSYDGDTCNFDEYPEADWQRALPATEKDSVLVEGQDLNKSPHIIFILADDLGWNDVSFHGSPQIPTPNLDTLAFTGSVLHNYYATPLCTPSRSALMTGKYPIRTGMQNYVVDLDSSYGLPLEEKILPQHLKELGYSTHLVGKWHLGHSTKAQTPNLRGFDSFYGYYAGRHDYYDQSVFNGDWRGYDMRRNLDVDWSAVGNYTTTLLANEAENVIRQHDPSSGPLFLYLAHLAPHSANRNDPLQAPPESIALFNHIEDPKRRIYAAMVHEMDKSIGQLVNALKQKNMLEESIIVFSGDNGGAANGMDNNVASNWPLRGAKNTTWEGGVRTTGVIWSPLLPTERRGMVIRDLFDITDWLPTFLEVAGGDPLSLGPIDGISQWQTIYNGYTSTKTQILHNIDDIFGYAGVRLGQFKLVKGTTLNGDFDGWFGPSGRENADAQESFDIDKYQLQLLNSDTGKAITSLGIELPENFPKIRDEFEIVCGEKPLDAVPCLPLEDSVCLFDLENDPCEYDNLAPTEPVLVQQLLDLIKWYKDDAVPPLYPLTPKDPNANPKYWNGTVTYWKDLMLNSPPDFKSFPPQNDSLVRFSNSAACQFNISMIGLLLFVLLSNAICCIHY